MLEGPVSVYIQTIIRLYFRTINTGTLPIKEGKAFAFTID
jgi:hypothetical protein